MENKRANADAMKRIKRCQSMLDKLILMECPQSLLEMSQMRVAEAKREYEALVSNEPVPDNIGTVMYDAELVSWSRQLITDIVEIEQCGNIQEKIDECTTQAR